MRAALERGGAAPDALDAGAAGWADAVHALLRGLARPFARAGLDPDDLVQEVAEKLLRRPVPADARAAAWVARVMRNHAIDRLRQRDARREVFGLDGLPIAEPRAAWWEALSEADVRAAAARLPAEQRAVFELFALEGRSYAEIAARLGIPPATVGTRILRARQKLRVLLEAAHGR